MQYPSRIVIPTSDPKLESHARAGYLMPHVRAAAKLESGDAFPRLVALATDRYRSLSELTDLRFFTPAILFCYGQFPPTILTQFLAEHASGDEIAFYTAVFPQPLFAGLETATGDRTWNFTLFALEHTWFDSFCDFAGSLVQVDQGRQRVVRCGVQDFTIVDPLSPERRLKIVSLGIDGSHGRVYLANRARGLPSPCCGEASEAMERYWKGVFGGENPQVLWDQK